MAKVYFFNGDKVIENNKDNTKLLMDAIDKKYQKSISKRRLLEIGC